jgi:hypothetical protein
MTTNKPLAKVRRDHAWKQSQPPLVVASQANATIERMLTVMGMSKKVELTRFIGCHDGDITKWRSKGVPLIIVQFISQHTNVSLDYLLYGKKPEFKATPTITSQIDRLINNGFKLGEQMRYLAQTDETGFTAMSKKITTDIVEYLNDGELHK